MIARNENTAGLQGSADGAMASGAGRGAVNHYLEDSPYLESMEAVNRMREAEGAELDEDVGATAVIRLDTQTGMQEAPVPETTGGDGSPSRLSYDDRREAYTGWIVTDLFDGEGGYFVDSRLDGEPRDEPEDVS